MALHTSLAALTVAVAVASADGTQNPAGLGCWSWEGGSKTVITDPPKVPLEPSGRCCAQSWATADAVYVFGGSGYLHNESDAVYLADMWRMDLETKSWQHVAGSLKANTAGDASNPPARNYAATWAVAQQTSMRAQSDSTSLWLWGGMGARYNGDVDGGYLNDIWRFDTTTNKWSKHAGKGSVQAPPRTWGNFWSSADGSDLWVQGGTGANPTPKHHDDDNQVPLNDMWHLKTGTLEWSMVYNASSFPATYNSSTPSDINPGFRSNSYTTSVTTKDGKTELYMYGGEGFSKSNHSSPWSPKGLMDGDYQDVWRFQPTSKLWHHIAGPRQVDARKATYGTKGTAAKGNLPPAEHAGYIWYTPYQDSMWFLGGENGSEASGMRNDLWAWNLTSHDWAWQAGSALMNEKGSYGELGHGSVSSSPGARYAGQSWVGNDEGAKLWMFGGYGNDAKGTGGYLNDVWTFTVPCPA